MTYFLFKKQLNCPVVTVLINYITLFEISVGKEAHFI